MIININRGFIPKKKNHTKKKMIKKFIYLEEKKNKFKKKIFKCIYLFKKKKKNILILLHNHLNGADIRFK
jgi:hypothetical protein